MIQIYNPTTILGDRENITITVSAHTAKLIADILTTTRTDLYDMVGGLQNITNGYRLLSVVIALESALDGYDTEVIPDAPGLGYRIG